VRIHQIIPASRVNGPGSRFVIWVQGCSRYCPGCFNPLTHEKTGGYEVSVKAIISGIPLSNVEGVTVSGGEPFEQSEDLAVFLEAIKVIGLNRLVYTGFRYEELGAMNIPSINRCLSLIDILVDGEYRQNIPPQTAWTGSGNQRVLKLSNGRVISEAHNEYVLGSKGEGEIFIDHAGGIVATGIFDGRDLKKAAGNV
jgi:anaerobic ribonucleoside-triphosphate reductase activating protein